MTSDSGHEKTGAQQPAFCREHKEDFYRFPFFLLFVRLIVLLYQQNSEIFL